MSTQLTESVNPRSRDIDLKSIPEIIDIINAEDQLVANAVHAAREGIIKAVEAAVQSLNNGGRMIYIGAGTSGRLGVMDAVECAPTYGMPYDRVFAIIAGGYDTMVKASENAEDNVDAGIKAMDDNHVTAADTIIGISASGNTPYVTGALKRARELGASTVGIICNANGTVADAAEIPIILLTGPEVITGSTRMKAGSAQKMTLNAISTTTMIRIGRVTGNFMTAMRPTNTKLRKRARFIVGSICGISEEDADALLEQHNYVIRDSVNAWRKQETHP